MRKILLAIAFMAIIFFVAGPVMGACTMIPGSRIESSGKYGSVVTIPLTCTCDASGGTVTATAIPDTAISGAQLIEVEVDPGASVAGVAATVTNARGTKIWEVDTINTSTNQIYGGHTEWGIFPVMDSVWSLSTGNLGANGSVTIYLKMSR